MTGLPPAAVARLSRLADKADSYALRDLKRRRALQIPQLAATQSAYFAQLVGAGAAVGCSAYVAFAYLADLDRLSPEVARHIANDRTAIYRWYLTDYTARHKPMRVPLSAADIADLAAPDHEFGGWPRIVAAFAAIERPDLLKAAAIGKTGAVALAFWWAIERAPTLGIDDCLVPEAFATLLCAPDSASPGFSCVEALILKADGFAPEDLKPSASCVTALLSAAIERPGLVPFLPQRLTETTLDLPEMQTLQSRIAQIASVAGFDGASGRFLSLLDNGDRLEPRLAQPETPALLSIKSDICVVGPIRQRSGLGQAARLSIEVLEKAGAKVSILNFDHGFPSPSDPALLPAHRDDIAADSAASALIHINPDLLPSVFAFAGQDMPGRRAGYFAWELDAPASCDFLAFDLIDAIWTHSRFVQKIYARVFQGDVISLGLAMPTKAVPLRTGSRATLARIAGIAPDQFTFLSVFDALSYAARKNPVGAIAAFRAAFPTDPDVALVLKTQNRPARPEGAQAVLWRAVEAACAEDNRIRVVDASLGYDDVLAMMSGADAFVSLHRSEGWGLGISEAMQMGTPVIATAYGGTEDFCNDETAFRVACDLVPVNPDDYVHAEPGRLWAEPRPDAAVQAFRSLRAQPALRTARAAAGQRLVAETMSFEAVGRRYVTALERLLAKT